VEVDRIIERGLRESHALDTEALCIVAGAKAWSIRCDIHVLDHGGNVIDAAALATVRPLDPEARGWALD
jgi:exosome complex component RRP45